LTASTAILIRNAQQRVQYSRARAGQEQSSGESQKEQAEVNQRPAGTVSTWPA
jgi:hypothetical protein